MERILWSALAAAFTLHPIKIISFVVMGNHVHLIALVEDPADVESFMERFKCETAHAVNRLLGRRQVTVWCEGYDSPAILTIDDLIEKLAYVYTNPVVAHRTDSIDNYQGVSSWQMFTSGQSTREVKRIRRPLLTPLPRGPLSPIRHKQLSDSVELKSNETLSFSLFPAAWKIAFPSNLTLDELNLKVLTRIREIEAEVALIRGAKHIRLPTAHEIVSQPIDTPYSPTSFGRRMWCICRDIPVRVSFIAFIRSLRAQAAEVRSRWGEGYRNEPFPPGLFPPCQPVQANLLPAFIRRALSPC
jgi:REP element-mobilizing transposase RayT